MKRAAFLDRDGVINRRAREGSYIVRWQDVEILPGVADAVALLNRAGFQVIVVTNQRCVAKGLMSAHELEALHGQMRAYLGSLGAVINGIYYCPHEKNSCACRKPEPGMLLLAATDHGIDLKGSWMIGDSDLDIAAGRRAGCKTVLLAKTADHTNSGADFLASSLLEAVNLLLACEESAPAAAAGASVQQHPQPARN